MEHAHLLYICIWSAIGPIQLVLWRWVETRLGKGWTYPFWLFVAAAFNFELLGFLYCHELGLI